MGEHREGSEEGTAFSGNSAIRASERPKKLPGQNAPRIPVRPFPVPHLGRRKSPSQRPLENSSLSSRKSRPVAAVPKSRSVWRECSIPTKATGSIPNGNCLLVPPFGVPWAALPKLFPHGSAGEALNPEAADKVRSHGNSRENHKAGITWSLRPGQRTSSNPWIWEEGKLSFSSCHRENTGWSQEEPRSQQQQHGRKSGNHGMLGLEGP